MPQHDSCFYKLRLRCERRCWGPPWCIDGPGGGALSHQTCLTHHNQDGHRDKLAKCHIVYNTDVADFQTKILTQENYY